MEKRAGREALNYFLSVNKTDGILNGRVSA